VLTVYELRRLVKAAEVTAGLAESNGSLPPGLWYDSLYVICGLTACTPGSAPGPTLGNDYGRTLPLPARNGFVYVFCSSYEVWTTSVAPACCSLSPEPVGFQSEASVNSQVIRTASPAAKPTVTFPAAEHYPLSSTYFPSH